MKMLYVPAEMLQAFRAARLEREGYLDLLHLLDIVSPEDVAFYLYLNAYPGKVIPSDIGSSFENVLITRVYGEEQQKLSPADYASHLCAGRVVIDDGFNKNIQRHLTEYCATHAPPQLNVDGKVLATEILWTSGTPTIVFTHVDGPVAEDPSPENSAAETYAFYDRLLLQLSQFMTTDRIAAYPIFNGYLQSLEGVAKAA